MTTIHDAICGLDTGAPITFRNLSMFPLLGKDAGPGDYLTLDEALAQKAIRITEVSESGSVPELRLISDSVSKVLLMDGEELVGAKQNRTLNITILAPAHTTLPLPVTCVEAGRWAHASAEFASASRSHYAAGRAMKNASVSESLRSRGSRAADQGEVWEDISAKSARMASPSATSAMAAMYEQNDTTVEQFVEALPSQPRQRGALFAIGGAIIGFDLFDCAATLGKLLPKIVRSYALDAMDSRSNTAAPSAEAVRAFLSRSAAAETSRFDAIGLGTDLRIQCADLAGGALEVDGHIVHLAVFASADRQADAESASLSRASSRRSSHFRAA